jgi:hypothetical protein
VLTSKSWPTCVFKSTGVEVPATRTDLIIKELDSIGATGPSAKAMEASSSVEKKRPRM